MVSSVLNPEKVVGKQNTNKAAAQNFISGGSVVGASVVNGAANKIVGFQRAGAQPAPSATSSIVSTISTNINNNVTSTINKTLQGFSADYQKRIKQVDDAKPIGVLGKFLNVYKTALGFINFFGNKKNIDKVRDNLEALKKSFTESFEVAKLIRQVIIKIVKQLSNLPVASPSGGGGLNLDVDIPGGPLRKTAPRNVNRMRGGGGKMLALGAGALGLGALGAGTVNALSDSPQDQVQAAQTSPDIPGDVADRFSSIVDRFANAVSKLFENKKQKPKQESSGSSGGGGAKPSAAPGSSPSAGSMDAADAIVSPEVDAAGLKSNFAPIAQDILESGKIDPSKLSDRAAMGAMLAVGQMETNFSYDKAYSGLGGRGNNMQGFLQLNRDYHKVSGEKQYLDYTIPKFQGKDASFTGGSTFNPLVFAENLKNAKTGFDVANAIRAAGFTSNDFDPLDTAKEANRLSEDQVVAIKKIVFGNMNLQNAPSVNPNKGMGGPAVDVSMISPEARKALGIQISQPPPSQQQQQPIVMPIDLSGGGQQQSGGGGGGGGPAPSQGSGPSVPFLPTSNPDNFLVLYSRMVYNIVDG